MDRIGPFFRFLSLSNKLSIGAFKMQPDNDNVLTEPKNRKLIQEVSSHDARN